MHCFELGYFELRFVGAKPCPGRPFKAAAQKNFLFLICEQMRLQFGFFAGKEESRFLQLKKEKVSVSARNSASVCVWSVAEATFWVEACAAPGLHLKLSFLLPFPARLASEHLPLTGGAVTLLAPLERSGHLAVVVEGKRLFRAALLESKDEFGGKTLEVLCLDSWDLGARRVSGVWETSDFERLLLATQASEVLLVDPTRAEVLKTVTAEAQVQWALDVVFSKRRVELFLATARDPSLLRVELKRKEVKRIYNRQALKALLSKAARQRQSEAASGRRLQKQRRLLEEQCGWV